MSAAAVQLIPRRVTWCSGMGGQRRPAGRWPPGRQLLAGSTRLDARSPDTHSPIAFITTALFCTAPATRDIAGGARQHRDVSTRQPRRQEQEIRAAAAKRTGLCLNLHHHAVHLRLCHHDAVLRLLRLGLRPPSTVSAAPTATHADTGRTSCFASVLTDAISPCGGRARSWGRERCGPPNTERPCPPMHLLRQLLHLRLDLVLLPLDFCAVAPRKRRQAVPSLSPVLPATDPESAGPSGASPCAGSVSTPWPAPAGQVASRTRTWAPRVGLRSGAAPASLTPPCLHRLPLAPHLRQLCGHRGASRKSSPMRVPLFSTDPRP